MLALPSVKLIFVIFCFNLFISMFAMAINPLSGEPTPFFIGEETIETPEYPEQATFGWDSSKGLIENITTSATATLGFISFLFSLIYPTIEGLPILIEVFLLWPLYIATTYILACIILWFAQTIGQIIPFT